MKKKYFTIYLLICSISLFGQDWIELDLPQSAILGAPVSQVIKGKDINFDYTIRYDKNPALDTRESAESKEEYEDKFRNFVTKYFNKEKVQVKSTKAYNLKIRSLNSTTIDKLQVGAKYVYEGIAADSVTIILSAKKSFSTDISKAVKDISDGVTGEKASKIIEKVAPFLDSISYEGNDSIFYKITVKNPNVYFKVKVIKLKKLNRYNWESACLYFFDRNGNDYPQTQKLVHDPTGVESDTKEYYPEFRGRNDRRDILYALRVKKVNGELQLWILETRGNIGQSKKPILEIPYVIEGGKKYWRLDRKLQYQFYHRKRIKSVLIQVAARQIDENTIEIINWKDASDCRNAQTYMKYPEFKAKYVKR